MSALARTAREMRVAAMPTGDRAYARLCDAATQGTEIELSDHELVLGISKALWNRETATAQLGLSELETRTSLAAVQERNAA